MNYVTDELKTGLRNRKRERKERGRRKGFKIEVWKRGRERENELRHRQVKNWFEKREEGKEGERRRKGFKIAVWKRGREGE